MFIELSVHVPSDLLRGSLRVVELLLRLALERLKFVLEHFELLLGARLRASGSGLVGAHLGGFRRDCDHF